MADWLAYGLEDAFGDTPDLAVVRRNRATAGLIRYDTRNETQDWIPLIREAIAQTKPRLIVMMIGLNDRQPIRERVTETVKPTVGTPVQPAPGQAPAQAGQTPAQAAASAAQPRNAPAAAQPKNAPAAAQANPAEGADAEGASGSQQQSSSIIVSEPSGRGGIIYRIHEFRSDEWTVAYTKKIDATVAALKSAGVPVFWVGLPSIRGPKSTNEVQYLDELSRSRVEKAGVTFIDVWDGFVDDSGRFTLQGPDFEGQTRRLRTSDGLHFTKSGARKLAHYLEREIRRVTTPGSEPIALPQSEPQIAPRRPRSRGRRHGRWRVRWCR